MAQYKTVFHTLAKILPRHGIDRLDRKYGQGERRDVLVDSPCVKAFYQSQENF